MEGIEKGEKLQRKEKYKKESEIKFPMNRIEERKKGKENKM